MKQKHWKFFFSMNLNYSFLWILKSDRGESIVIMIGSLNVYKNEEEISQWCSLLWYGFPLSPYNSPGLSTDHDDTDLFRDKVDIAKLLIFHLIKYYISDSSPAPASALFTVYRPGPGWGSGVPPPVPGSSVSGSHLWAGEHADLRQGWNDYLLG